MVESIALNRVSSALRAVMQLQAVHTVHMVDGKALPVSELQLDPVLHLQFFVRCCCFSGALNIVHPHSQHIQASKRGSSGYFGPCEMFRVNPASVFLLSACGMVPAGPL